jgi:phosphatidylserine decarboxylase
VKAGDRFGVMKFGSRMDIFLPRDATLSTKVGDKVLGGITVMGSLPDARARTREEQARVSLVH